MPSLSNITSTFFVDLITRLGIRPPPPEAFLLSNIVNPVSIVDSGVVLQSISTTQLLDGSFSAGPLVAPVAGTILADTGQLPQGNYLFFITIGMLANANSADFIFGRRNAANAAYVWRGSGAIVQSNAFLTFSFQARILLNERFRIEEATNAGAGLTIEANVFAQLLTAG